MGAILLRYEWFQKSLFHISFDAFLPNLKIDHETYLTLSIFLSVDDLRCMLMSEREEILGQKEGMSCSIYVVKDEIGTPRRMRTKSTKPSMLWVDFGKRDVDDRDDPLSERH